jgi:hypothetical protein
MEALVRMGQHEAALDSMVHFETALDSLVQHETAQSLYTIGQEITK